MKRSEALAPLSRDHHRALVVARELTRADGDSAAAARERFVDFLAGHELGHFRLEETVLVPVVPKDGSGAVLVERMLADHEFLRDALTRLRAASGSVELSELHQVGARLRDHVKLEEQQLFPLIEAALTEAQLDQVGAAIRAGGA